jgi:uncharacterized protein (TIGR02996 family)
MSDESALLAAIWEHPQEDTPRLMYADWLDERGGESEAARAELIRVQCALESLDGDDPRFDELEARAEALQNKWDRKWRRAMPKGCKQGYVYTRGFPVPYLGQLSVAGLVKQGESRMKCAPLWRYHYGVYGRHLDELLAWPYLHRLEMFALRPDLPDGWAKRLAACDGLRNVTDLQLIDCWLSADEMQTILDAWTGRHLRTLRFDTSDSDALWVLANHPAAAGLRSLVIDECRLPTTAIRHLARGKSLTQLIGLTFDYGRMGDALVKELLKWPVLRKLRSLSLAENRLTNAGAVALAKSRSLANLRSLWLGANRIGAKGIQALVASPHLARVTKVTLYDNPGMKSEAARTAVRARFPGTFLG